MRIERRFMAFAALTMLLAGCDLGGTYEQRFQASLTSVGQEAALNNLLHADPTEVPGSGITLRLPATFDSGAKSLPATDPAAQPPFANLPGLNYAMERLLGNDPQNPTTYAAAYIYLAAVPKAEKKSEDVQTEVQKQVGTAFAGANWTETQIGKGQSGKLMSVSGQQDFVTADAAGGRATAKLDGQFDLYLLESGSHVVLVGFRAPKAEAATYALFDAVKAAIGTVEGG
jgi:hypothetical protein